jgi:glycosyltransferase involved in cell wall biosynthesis
MRIAQFVSARVLNGAARHCLSLSEALTARGHEVLLFHRPELAEAIQAPPGVQLRTTDYRRGLRSLADLGRLLASSRVEVIHTHMSSAHTTGAILRAWKGVPTVATAHARHFQLHWRFNDRVIAPTRSTAEFHRRVNLIPAGRIAVIPNFVDADRFAPPTPDQRRDARQRLGAGDTTIVIGQVADIVALKRPSDLAEASRRLLEGGDALLLIAGAELDREESRRLARASEGLDGKVRRLGRLADVRELLHASDIFALASLTEEAPMSILEAMAAGIPVASTAVGGVSELVSHEATGLLSPARNVPALAASLERLAADAGLRRRMGDAGRARAVQEFAKAPIVDRIERVLQETAALRPRWVRDGAL